MSQCIPKSTALRFHKVSESISGHIKKPYTIDEILDKIEDNDYNSELIMQHLFKWIDGNLTDIG